MVEEEGDNRNAVVVEEGKTWKCSGGGGGKTVQM